MPVPTQAECSFCYEIGATVAAIDASQAKAGQLKSLALARHRARLVRCFRRHLDLQRRPNDDETYRQTVAAFEAEILRGAREMRALLETTTSLDDAETTP